MAADESSVPLNVLSFLDEGGPEASSEDQVFDCTNIEEDLELYGKDDLIAEALGSGGADLRHYVKRIEGDLRKVERESIADYVQESENLAHLHMKIRSSDQVLANMQDMLGHFQTDLGKVNQEIKTLQERAQNLSVRARNRKAVEGKLSHFVDGVGIPPRIIHTITEAEVNETYMEYLLLLRRKFSYVEGPEALSAGCVSQVRPVLEKLRIKAIERIRYFLLEKIYALGRPKTNFQILQQNVLLKFKHLAQFLREHGEAVYKEVKGQYIETMGAIYLGHFKAHMRHVSRCQVETMTAGDLIVQPEDTGAQSSINSLSSLWSGVNVGGVMSLTGLTSSSGGGAGVGVGGEKPKEMAFMLGARAAILQQDGAKILMQVTAEHQTKQRPEVIFSGMLALLTSAASSEQIFVSEFFSNDELLASIFRPSIQVIEEQCKGQVESSFDPLALLLMIRTVQDLSKTLEQRQLSGLQSFLDMLAMILWPRFKTLLDLQMESVRNANAPALMTPKAEKYPHHVTRRYAELSASILQLKNETSAEMLQHSLNYMRNEFESLLVRMGMSLNSRIKQLVFMINQLDAIVSLYAERGVSGAAGSADQNRMDAEIGTFVEEELEDLYGPLVKLVKEVEERIKQPGAESEPQPVIPLSRAKPLVEGFASTWKQGIEKINVDVMGNFHKMKSGMEILKRTLTQLLLYYTRFLELVKKYCKESSSLSRDMVNIPSIIAEIKKYSRTF